MAAPAERLTARRQHRVRGAPTDGSTDREALATAFRELPPVNELPVLIKYSVWTIRPTSLLRHMSPYESLFLFFLRQFSLLFGFSSRLCFTDSGSGGGGNCDRAGRVSSGSVNDDNFDKKNNINCKDNKKNVITMTIRGDNNINKTNNYDNDNYDG